MWSTWISIEGIDFEAAFWDEKLMINQIFIPHQ